MIHKIRVYTDSGLIVVKADAGTRLIDALAEHGVQLSAPCGGRCFCGKCRVRVEGAVSQMSETESGLLSESDRKTGIRLACAAILEGDAEVWLETDASQILISGENEEPYSLDPPIRVKKATLATPSLENPRSDESRLADALGVDSVRLPAPLLRILPDLSRANGGTLWATTFTDGGATTVRDISTEEPAVLGAAVDIGTTTVAAYLVDLKTGKSLDACSMLNPQRAHGADVISRSDFASRSEGLEALQREIATGVSGLIDSMLRKTGEKQTALRQIVCVGNTVMMHLLWGVTPKHISVTPFVPAFSDSRRAEATDIGMPFTKAVIETAPCVAGYVGADTVAAILACGMDASDEVNLLIDIGTNGEIALGGKGGLLCCSAAAGPAFEGAHIRCGSGAINGAISGVRFEDDGTISIKCIGGGEPRSLCGSGLVDAIAEMLRTGVIDETGRIDEDEAPEVFSPRLTDGKVGLSLSLDGEGRVYICQKDVREVQLAKSAIAAGIEILLEQAGVGFDDIAHLYLSGGFGNYIDIHNACLIGLLPKQLENRIVPIGNGAGTGAKRILLNREAGDRTRSIAAAMRYIELSAQSSFTDRFSENMLFGDI